MDPISLAVPVVVGGSVVFQSYRVWARRAYVRRIASANDWRFEESNRVLATSWPGRPFDRGEHRDAVNVLRGSRGGRTFTAFDLVYDLRSVRVQRRFGVIVLRLPAALPRLVVEPEIVVGEGARRAVDLGAVLRFESDEFNRAFRVSCDSERFGRAVVHPRMMELLLDRGELPWRIAGNHLIGWHRGRYGSSDLDRRLALLEQVVGLIPPYVWTDFAIGHES
jgi:hypothetical protein